MLLNICEFRENRHMDGRTFPVVVNEIIFSLVPWNRVIFLKWGIPR